jgi:hypothetical protein
VVRRNEKSEYFDVQDSQSEARRAKMCKILGQATQFWSQRTTTAPQLIIDVQDNWKTNGKALLFLGESTDRLDNN